jgi:GT2 family glycosyltransferase
MSINSYNGKKIKNRFLCSVCIANFNGEQFLEKCINSVLIQEGVSGPVEIIIHDDASTDNSVSLIQSRYSQVRLIASDKNVGFCVSNNRMVTVARGIFILLLNNDAILHKDALKTMIDASEKIGDGILGLPQYDADSGELIDFGSVFDPFLNPIPNKDVFRQDVGMVIGACLWLPKTLWDELGGFPEWFGSLAEDMYLCCFARLKGYPVQVNFSSKFHHWVGKSIGGGKIINNKLSTTLTRRALSERNKLFVMLICYPFFFAILIIPTHLFLLIAEGLLLSVIKRDKRIWLQIYWFCIKEIWIKRRLWLKQRRMVQNVRRCSTRVFMATFTLLPHKIRMLFVHGIPDVH